MVNEHVGNPGAVIGINGIKLLLLFGPSRFLLLFFEPTANLGRPRFLCLISIHVSHFPNAEHLLQGRDTFLKWLIPSSLSLFIYTYNHILNELFYS